MTEIQLRDGGMVYVDDQDVSIVSGYYWRKNANGYAIGHLPAPAGHHRYVMMHRLIAGALPGTFVDHVDGNKLDNRRANLRLCTKSQNGGNIRCVRSRSGFKGVVYYAKSGKWKAQIQVNRVVRYLGLYITPREAAIAYDAAAVAIHGEFAATNAMLGTLS